MSADDDQPSPTTYDDRGARARLREKWAEHAEQGRWDIVSERDEQLDALLGSTRALFAAYGFRAFRNDNEGWIEHGFARRTATNSGVVIILAPGAPVSARRSPGRQQITTFQLALTYDPALRMFFGPADGFMPDGTPRFRAALDIVVEAVLEAMDPPPKG